MSISQLFNKISLLLLISFITVFAQDFIQVTSPQQNQVIGSKQDISISYTVIGAQTLQPPPVNATYPSSMILSLQWLAKGTTDNPITLTANNNLITTPYVAGITNKQYSSIWKTPNCHFFSRYNPNNYDFSLVFTPRYTGQIQPDQQQGNIVVPLSVQINNSTFPRC